MAGGSNLFWPGWVARPERAWHLTFDCNCLALPAIPTFVVDEAQVSPFSRALFVEPAADGQGMNGSLPSSLFGPARSKAPARQLRQIKRLPLELFKLLFLLLGQDLHHRLLLGGLNFRLFRGHFLHLLA